MQPGEPLIPGETYYDKDLDVEVIAVPSETCRHPDSNELVCVYRSGCEHGTGCYRSSLESLPSVVYLPKLQYATFKLTQLVI